jgi:hypothetical protein
MIDQSPWVGRSPGIWRRPLRRCGPRRSVRDQEGTICSVSRPICATPIRRLRHKWLREEGLGAQLTELRGRSRANSAARAITGASPSRSVAARMSAKRAPPETSAVSLDATATLLMPPRSITTPSHKARPVQSSPPPRTDSGRPQARAARMAKRTSSAVRQWTTTRGMRPTGLSKWPSRQRSHHRSPSTPGRAAVR